MLLRNFKNIFYRIFYWLTDWCLQTHVTWQWLRLRAWFFCCSTLLQPERCILPCYCTYNAFFMDLSGPSFVFHSSLSWSDPIAAISNKANSMHTFLQRNLWQSSPSTKSLAYLTYVRLIVEYTSIVWSTYVKLEFERPEMVQHKAANFFIIIFQHTLAYSLYCLS